MTEESRRGGGRASDDDRKAIVVAGESKKVTVKSADMRDDMQREAVDCALLVLTRFSSFFLSFFLRSL